jgi:hypothetical protein
MVQTGSITTFKPLSITKQGSNTADKTLSFIQEHTWLTP